jgi:hypothetical protein
VEALFDLIKQQTAVLPFFGADRTGAGLPTLATNNLQGFPRLAGMRAPAMPQGVFMQPNYFLVQPLGQAA